MNPTRMGYCLRLTGHFCTVYMVVPEDQSITMSRKHSDLSGFAFLPLEACRVTINRKVAIACSSC